MVTKKGAKRENSLPVFDFQNFQKGAIVTIRSKNIFNNKKYIMNNDNKKVVKNLPLFRISIWKSKTGKILKKNLKIFIFFTHFFFTRA